MKLTAAVVVVCGLVLAGCGSGGDDTAPAAATSSAFVSAKPTVVLTDPGDTQGSVAMTPTNPRGTNDPVSSDLTGTCTKLLTVDDPSTQLTTLGLMDAVMRQALVANYSTPAVTEGDLDTLLAAMQDASRNGGSTLNGPVGQLGAAVLLVQQAVNAKTTVDPQLTYSLVTENIRQIKVTCSRAGVVGP